MERLHEDEEVTKLVITLNNTQPVELIDLAQSMLALAAEYRQMLLTSGGEVDPDEVRLYIKEVRSGSIVQELVPYAAAVLPLVTHYNTIVSFAGHLNDLKTWFVKHRTMPTSVAPLDRKSLLNFTELLEPVAKDPGSSLSIQSLTINGGVNISVVVGSQEAAAIQNNISHALKDMKRSVAGEHKRVVMYWSQARNAIEAKSGDKAVIESISRAAVKIVFSSDDLKKRMLFDVAHPFEKAFVVDVWVETVHEKPVLYVVHEFHDVIDREA